MQGIVTNNANIIVNFSAKCYFEIISNAHRLNYDVWDKLSFAQAPVIHLLVNKSHRKNL